MKETRDVVIYYRNELIREEKRTPAKLKTLEEMNFVLALSGWVVGDKRAWGSELTEDGTKPPDSAGSHLSGGSALREYHRILWRQEILGKPGGPAWLTEHAKRVKCREQDLGAWLPFEQEKK